MMDEAICVGCGGDCLQVIGCSCGRREVYACQDCRDGNLVCGDCRDRAVRVVPVGAFPCRDMNEAGVERDPGGRLPAAARA